MEKKKKKLTAHLFMLCWWKIPGPLLWEGLLCCKEAQGSERLRLCPKNKGTASGALCSSKCGLKTGLIRVPGSLLEEQNLRIHSRPAESESVLYQDPQVIHMHVNVWEILQTISKYPPEADSTVVLVDQRNVGAWGWASLREQDSRHCPP